MPGGLGGSSGSSGAGGGTGTDLCSSSPSDQQSQIDNLITRVEVIEAVLSQLLGVDISVLQVSDLSQDLGNILSGTFSGGALSQLASQFGRVDAFSISGGNPFMAESSAIGEGGVTNNSFEAPFFGNVMALIPNATLHDVSGVQAGNDGPSYRQTNDPKVGNWHNGGFMMDARAALYQPDSDDPNVITVPSKMRWFLGFADANIQQSNATWDADDFGSTGYADGVYMGFHVSAPRGDSTFKFVVKDGPGPVLTPLGPQHIYDTGMPVLTGTYYDFNILYSPGGSTINYSITMSDTGATVSGSAPISDYFIDGDIETGVGVRKDSPLYRPATAIWNSVGATYNGTRLYIHHMWTQSLNVINP